MNQHLQTILNFIQQDYHLSAEEKTSLTKAVKDSESELTVSEIKLEKNLEELEQKRKVIAKQSRELEIEAALERVRSRSMAMRKSEELADLSLELVKQVQSLGVATWFCTFNIYDEDGESSMEWGSNGEGTFTKYRTPREGIFLRYYEAGKRGETLLINEIGEDECPAHYDFLCSLPGVGDQLLKMKKAGLPFPTSQIDHVAFFKYGYIIFITYEPSSESHDIFKRFAKVFEQTYTRFLDLQKAEAQAREAQIENALEKVRSRTMAMQKSSELQDASLLLFQQVQSLGIPPFACGFNIWDDDKKAATAWMGSVQGLQPPFKTSSAEDIYLPIYEASQRGESLFVKEQAGKELEIHYQYLATIPVFRDIIMVNWSKAGVSFPTFQIIHCAFFSQGYLMFISFEQVPEAHEIFKRFAKVFEQTYTRFLDLQKAEEQAREAQIESALERVRSRSLAMHNSEELEEVILVVSEQLQQLQFRFHNVSFGFNNEQMGLNFWLASPGQPKPYLIKISYLDNPAFNLPLQTRNNGADFSTDILTREENRQFLQHIFENSMMGNLSEENKIFLLSTPGFARSQVLMKNTILTIGNYSLVPYTDSQTNCQIYDLQIVLYLPIIWN